jgi:hypothetical protein
MSNRDFGLVALGRPMPRHGDHGRFHRLLHDQTGRDLFAALNRLSRVNVAIVHPPAAAARHRTARAARIPTTHEIPANRYARRH